jgi:hypothetical protein
MRKARRQSSNKDEQTEESEGRLQGFQTRQKKNLRFSSGLGEWITTLFDAWSQGIAGSHKIRKLALHVFHPFCLFCMCFFGPFLFFPFVCLLLFYVAFIANTIGQWINQWMEEINR